MSLMIGAGGVRVTGVASVEDAETLLSALDATPRPTLDLAAATHLHAAVLQVLLACRPDIVAPQGAPALAAALDAAGLVSSALRDAA